MRTTNPINEPITMPAILPTLSMELNDELSLLEHPPGITHIVGIIFLANICVKKTKRKTERINKKTIYLIKTNNDDASYMYTNETSHLKSRRKI